MLTDDDIALIINTSHSRYDLAQKIIAAYEAKLREENEPVCWTHSCNVLCLDNVELWIDRCPHCGKPSPFGVTK